jgi:integrase
LGQYGDVQVASITSETCQKYITERDFSSDTTKANAIRYLSVFFNFAVKRGYIAKSPMANIERPKVKYSVPEFIPVADLERLMRESVQDIVLTPRMAIGTLAGLRPTELARLQPEDIDFEAGVIHIRPEVSKTGRPRHVTMSANLRAWLTRYPFTTANNFDERRAKACARAGITKWPHDCLRHTFATYHLAMYQDAGKTSFELGHSKGSAVLYRHYAGLASKADAERFWSLMPQKDS